MLIELSKPSEPWRRRGGVMKEAGVAGTAEGCDFLAKAISSEPIAQTPRVSHTEGRKTVCKLLLMLFCNWRGCVVME